MTIADPKFGHLGRLADLAGHRAGHAAHPDVRQLLEARVEDAVWLKVGSEVTETSFVEVPT